MLQQYFHEQLNIAFTLNWKQNEEFRDKFSIRHPKWILKFWSLFSVFQQPLLSAWFARGSTLSLVNESTYHTISWWRELDFNCFTWWFYISFISSNHSVCFMFYIPWSFPFLFLNIPRWNKTFLVIMVAQLQIYPVNSSMPCCSYALSVNMR